MKKTTQLNFEVKTKTYNKIKKECLENEGGFIKDYLKKLLDNHVEDKYIKINLEIKNILESQAVNKDISLNEHVNNILHDFALGYLR